MDWLVFALLFLACCGAGATGALFPPGDWYRTLKHPSFTPPDWLFPVAWTSIYLLISFAGARVAASPEAGIALALWAVQIAFNVLWSPVFFGLQRIRSAMFVVSALWISVLTTTIAFFAIDWIAGLAFLPYLVWVTVASALNWSFMRLNPDYAT
ncbi:MAG: TspO/MBR family protein [Pseudomonadota bacterium]